MCVRTKIWWRLHTVVERFLAIPALDNAESCNVGLSGERHRVRRDQLTFSQDRANISSQIFVIVDE